MLKYIPNVEMGLCKSTDPWCRRLGPCSMLVIALKPSANHSLRMRSSLPKLQSSLADLNPHPLQTLPSPSFHLLSTQKAHAQLLKSGTPVESSHIVPSYCNCGAFPSARKLFDETSHWDLVSATAIIGAFARHNRHRDAVALFSRILSLDIRPNQFTFGTTLHSSTALRSLDVGRQLHACTTKMGLQSNVFVGSSLLDHYAKLGTIEEAQRAFEDTCNPNVVSYTALISGCLKNERFDDALWLFRSMPERNVVSWNAMIGGCSQVGLNEESVNLFVEMCREGVRPNESTFPCVLGAAANIAALGMGRSFHACAIKYLSRPDVYVGNSLISFYAKCGCLEDSVLVFDKLEERNVVSWNAAICGCAQNGRGELSLELYGRMRASNLKPNGVTLLGLLFGCTHAGLVKEGYNYFNLAKTEQPEILRAEHHACVVDLLARSGRLGDAERFLQELPFEPGIGFWKALLGGCQIHSNKDLAETVARRIIALDPKDISSYVLLSNVYSAAGRWQSVSAIRREMKEKEMRRIPGCSWIEIRNEVHVFFNGDRKHPQTDEIYRILMTCLDN
ncbi:pentatricopeptide repeat-containing protein At5g42450, mitochondrial [Phoenix dactylifera]|uniref:Pentatricopeptide repeat-containing protein At5g42450, mitochondrial n=1 Tax=Phoenix dactylifera TaxID=42345 RepID=A0A8B7BYL2_PHODC|nr:pentatricopeptide repeat-containing protein At5g42450, mitochondrial [Phoenix dactylifera]